MNICSKPEQGYSYRRSSSCSKPTQLLAAARRGLARIDRRCPIDAKHLTHRTLAEGEGQREGGGQGAGDENAAAFVHRLLAH